MPVYKITHPDTGKTIKVEGDSPPTDADIDQIFADLEKSKPATDSQDIPGLGLAKKIIDSGVFPAATAISDVAKFVNEKAQQSAAENLAAVNTSPEGQAVYQMAGDMNPAQAATVMAGSGFKDVLRGFGLTDQKSESDKLAEQALRAQYPIAGAIGEAAGQAAPFIPFAMAMPQVAAGGLARAGIGSAVGAVEGGIISNGTGGSAEDNLKSALIGAALGPLGELLPVAKKISAGVNRLFGKEIPPTELLTPQGTPTPQLQSIIEQTGVSVDDLARQGEQGASINLAKNAAREATADIPQVQGIIAAAQPDKEIIDLLNKAGIDNVDIPLSMVARSHEALNLSSTLRAISNSIERKKYDEAAVAVRDFAKNEMQDMGAILAKGDLSEEVLQTMRDKRKVMHDIEQPAWKMLDQEIQSAIADTGASRVVVRDNRLKEQLQKELADQPETGLSPLKAKVLKLMEGRPTYQDIRRMRQEIGAALGSIPSGDFVTANQAELASMYAPLADLQSKAASTLVGAGRLREVNEMTKARKALENQIDFFTKGDIRGSIITKLTNAKSGLANQDYKQIDNLLENLPDEAKKPVMLSLITDAMKLSADSGSEKLIDKNGFIKTWTNVRANEGLANRFKTQIGDDAFNRINNLHKLAQAMQRAEKIPATGAVTAALNKYNSSSFMSKLLSMTGAIPGAGRASNIASNVIKEVTDSPAVGAEAVDILIGSDTFKRAMVEAAQNPEASNIININNRLNNAKVVQRALAETSPAVRREIGAAGGLITWLLSTQEQNNQSQN